VRSAQEVLYTLREVQAVNLTLVLAPAPGRPGNAAAAHTLRCNGVQFSVESGRVVTLGAPALPVLSARPAPSGGADGQATARGVPSAREANAGERAFPHGTRAF
jgi:hypothetical protein